MVKETKGYPELVFQSASLDDLAADLDDGQTLIIIDASQEVRLHNFRHLALVDSNCISHVQAIISGQRFNRYVGVGGCAVLDVARACAGMAGAHLYLVPTFLSTSCISVDRSVLRYDGKYRASVTCAPEKVFILDEFLNTHDNPTILRAARAGFGDFFAGISAAIDFSFRNGNFTPAQVSELAEFCLTAADWVLNRFNGYDRHAMRRLARYSHISSLMVIKRGDTALSAGGEHKLYYAIMEKHLYETAHRPFHGELVAVGSLMMVWAFARKFDLADWYARFRAVCIKLGLPVDINGLQQIGLSAASLQSGLQLITEENGFLSATVKEILPETLVRKVFDEQPS